MMKRLQIALLVLLVALAAATVVPVCGQSGDFIIEDADETNTFIFTHSLDLESRMGQVDPRFVMEFAKANQHFTLTPIPAALENLLNTIQPRFVMEFAKRNRFYALTPIPGQLNTLLEQIVPRFVIQYANANRELELHFPADLIDDTTPPEVSNIVAEMTGETSATVSWNTDEYADSTVECGTAPGTYITTFSDPLYVEEHTVILTGLTPETTYYCRIGTTDLSGNTYLSQEFSLGESETQASFTASPTNGLAPLTVVFTNTSTGGYTSSLWTFGNGVTSTTESPTNTYAIGVYTVSLRVNAGISVSDTLTRTNFITACHGTDVICDCIIDIRDIQAVAGHWRCEQGGCYEPDYDINSDGRIDVIDIMLVAVRFGCSCGDDCYTASLSVAQDNKVMRKELGSCN